MNDFKGNLRDSRQPVCSFLILLFLFFFVISIIKKKGAKVMLESKQSKKINLESFLVCGLKDHQLLFMKRK